ncbi:hypothetical protein GUITHDRAFT_119627 [Guillardia theta CCMP2712]|uniref:Mitochondrial carrier protein n=1 Tax=Guillardia theta (strain CCMP2712) TaxID=905079 RepID=L1IEF3_GUITC|nr:hypothetical protein GUITHDRAFT_119627 [Guillardia theta CCMP2712]EKX34210.1 hypothetical protein GUITHDRAFT_119627 [Guillardia theta CCMP2712]|eukprot:XP_005821190.1 hypothetical protein GUITHDRAFT_119627 [Guillardia theta CCMP2712]
MDQGERAMEPSAGFLAIIRSVMMVKLKTLVRVMSFKAFKPSHPHYSWLQRFKDAAKLQEKTLTDYLRHVLQREGLCGVVKRALPAYMGSAMSSMTLYSVYSEMQCLSSLSQSVYFRVSHHRQTFREVMGYGCAAGAAHGIVSAPTKIILNAYYNQPRGSSPSLSLPALRRLFLPKHWSAAAMTLLKDSLAFGAFFGGYEACKQTSTRQVAELLEGRQLLLDRHVALVSGAAVLSGGFAGFCYTSVKFPIGWFLERKHGSRPWVRFPSLFFKAAALSSLPNACSFLALELFLHYSGMRNIS